MIKELKNYRLENKISQEKLAEMLGVAFSTVNRWLNEISEPNEIQTHHIKKLLTKGVSVRSGNALFIEKKPPSKFIHLGYSAIDTNKINKGMDIIVKEIKLMMDKSH